MLFLLVKVTCKSINLWNNLPLDGHCCAGWMDNLQGRLVLGLVVVGSQVLGREAGESSAHCCNLTVHLYCNLAVHLFCNLGCTLCTISSMAVHIYCNFSFTF